eukprot:290554-Amphidinium_carterae.1
MKMSGTTGKEHSSTFAHFLESIFHCRVDVPVGDGHHNLLRYVAGYVAKASDALHFRAKDASTGTISVKEESKWRQVYRLLCRRRPLEQEMIMDFACLPMEAQRLATLQGLPTTTTNSISIREMHPPQVCPFFNGGASSTSRKRMIRTLLELRDAKIEWNLRCDALLKSTLEPKPDGRIYVC